MVPRTVIDRWRELIKSLVNGTGRRKEKEGPRAVRPFIRSPNCNLSVPPPFPFSWACQKLAPRGLLLILQPQGVCLSKILLAIAIWIGLRSYYPLKQESTTSLVQVPQIGNKFCQRHQSGQKNIFPIFRTGVTSTH